MNGVRTQPRYYKAELRPITARGEDSPGFDPRFTEPPKHRSEGAQLNVRTEHRLEAYATLTRVASSLQVHGDSS